MSRSLIFLSLPPTKETIFQKEASEKDSWTGLNIEETTPFRQDALPVKLFSPFTEPSMDVDIQCDAKAISFVRLTILAKYSGTAARGIKSRVKTFVE
ncbi:MAG TPA: hypothetical protein VIE66_04515 [Methylocella sp.]